MRTLLLLVVVAGCAGAPAPQSSVAQSTPDTSEPLEAAAVIEAPVKPVAPVAVKPATPIADRYREVAGKIIKAALADKGAWAKLEHMTDRIGHRLSGSPALERAVAWAIAAMKADGHENVRGERVMVPHWVRGAESAHLIAPVKRKLHILGLGGTVGTPRRGITAEVIVVNGFVELAALGPKVKGKIVLYAHAMPAYTREKGAGYGEAAKYRVGGPSVAAKLGARAVLVRSLTAHSLRTPHTGTLWYKKGAPKIPAAAVTVEDAELIQRLVASGDKVRVTLKLGARTLADAPSANVIGEIRGSDKPDEIVLIGAHIDSWDVGHGAHDDATGCVIMMQALTVLRKLGVKPRRTIRVVLFTNEENGGRGADAYVRDHADEISKHVMVMEADSGGFAPRGFEVEGSDAVLAQVKDIVTLLAPLGATESRKGYAGADVAKITKKGVPGLGHWVDESLYFDYHHTHADTLDKVVPADLAKNVAAVAVMAFVVADMPAVLGKK